MSVSPPQRRSSGLARYLSHSSITISTDNVSRRPSMGVKQRLTSFILRRRDSAEISPSDDRKSHRSYGGSSRRSTNTITTNGSTDEDDDESLPPTPQTPADLSRPDWCHLPNQKLEYTPVKKSHLIDTCIYHEEPVEDKSHKLGLADQVKLILGSTMEEVDELIEREWEAHRRQMLETLQLPKRWY
ncbi:uncharacterized protein BYT42DRAFT_611896 [Radiomyces spectabilis]|uniref:uncharacterized protein n=1 Tax=Radiomyces spectabilis TaxID=64574 RepID=UPI002220F279|nr:uncharacterized protein BYT42DRAFT_611896 [Radiomyces spectabilis]KAI8388908.1 hypothetical protein BYT42DRAFT_611896 [Radiomyces spectabilis]